MEIADPKVVAYIQALTLEEQKRLVYETVDYATGLVATKARWIGREILPKGYDAESLALEALRRSLGEGGRCWDPEKDPNFGAYPRSVVKSILWDLQKAAKKEALTALPDDAGKPVADPSGAPDAVFESRASLESLKQRMLASLDDEAERDVLLCFFIGVEKPADIAKELGLEVNEVNNIKKRIKRKLAGFQEESRSAKR